jgi:hypothetical protein
MMAQSAAVERAATGEDSAGTNDSQGSSGKKMFSYKNLSCSLHILSSILHIYNTI